MKTATNICLLEAQQMRRIPENTAIISILDESWPYQLNIPQTEDILALNFSDIGRPQIIDKDRVYNGINRDQAEKIREFCAKNKEKNFIVHCHAGVSRSSAICLYLNLCHNHRLKDNFFDLSSPNSFVLTMLLNAYYIKELRG